MLRVRLDAKIDLLCSRVPPWLAGCEHINTANSIGGAIATGCGAGRNVAHQDEVLQHLSETDLNEEDTARSKLIEGKLFLSWGRNSI